MHLEGLSGEYLTQWMVLPHMQPHGRFGSFICPFTFIKYRKHWQTLWLPDAIFGKVTTFQEERQPLICSWLVSVRARVHQLDIASTAVPAPRRKLCTEPILLPRMMGEDTGIQDQQGLQVSLHDWSSTNTPHSSEGVIHRAVCSAQK